MASLEGEALLLGTWKNIDELEESLTLEELHLVIDKAREKEHRMMKFYAAFKGVNLDEQTDTKERFEEIQRRAEARLRGKTEEELEWEALGIDIVVE